MRVELIEIWEGIQGKGVNYGCNNVIVRWNLSIKRNMVSVWRSWVSDVWIFRLKRLCYYSQIEVTVCVATCSAIFMCKGSSLFYFYLMTLYQFHLHDDVCWVYSIVTSPKMVATIHVWSCMTWNISVCKRGKERQCHKSHNKCYMQNSCLVYDFRASFAKYMWTWRQR